MSLSRGLVFAGIDGRDVITNAAVKPRIRTASPVGPAWKSGANSSITCAAQLLGGTTAFTVAFWASITTIVPFGGLLSVPATSGAWNGSTAQLTVYSQNAPATQGLISWGTGVGEEYALGTAPWLIADSTWHGYCAVRNGSNVKAYRDGVEIWSATATGNSALRAVSDGEVQILHLAGVTVETVGSMAAPMIWRRALLASEVVAVHRDPLAPLRANTDPAASRPGIATY